VKTGVKRWEELFNFIDTRKHWVYKEEENRVIGSRTFQYGRYTAVLWIEAQTRRDGSGGIFSAVMAHISIPFSAGPEESVTGVPQARKSQSSARCPEVAGWVEHKEQVLTLPLRIAEAKTYAGALMQACDIRNSADLYTLSYVFDLDFHEASNSKLRRELVKRCAPHLVRKDGHNG
jgi:hypothetical protein